MADYHVPVRVPEHTLVLPIMYDLAHEGSAVVPGPGTKAALDHAIREAERRSRSPILLTACAPPDPHWGGCVHGKVAERYVGIEAPELPTAFHKALSYNTIGEVVAAAEFIEYHRGWTTGTCERIETLLVIVKWWHAPRTRMIFRRVFRHRKIRCEIVVKTHWRPLSPKELIHELGGFVENWKRLTELMQSWDAPHPAL